MTKKLFKTAGGAALMAALVFSLSANANAAIQGLTGNTFNLTAKAGYILTPEGDALFMWGYANGAGPMQYIGPTLIVNEGTTVTVTLQNTLDEPVSIIFPGQENVVATGGTQGLITREVASGGGTVTYTFKATHPGTYIYHSGSDPMLQCEMGLQGALIVRSNTAGRAYDSPDTSYDREFLFFETEVDPVIHELVETGRKAEVNFSKWWPTYWMLNGRSAPDTMAMDNVSWLPNQPYSCMPAMHPGEKILFRIINGGREQHPLHSHGNFFPIFARDGRLLQSQAGSTVDLSESHFTFSTPPGGTADAYFTWTGEKLGWDIYGHAPGDPLQPNEYAPDHGKPFPVLMPDVRDLVHGDFYSGSPFLGTLGFCPSGQCAFNLNGGIFFMVHSHTEREMVNDDVFPGGMMTMLVIEHPSVTIVE